MIGKKVKFYSKDNSIKIGIILDRYRGESYDYYLIEDNNNALYSILPPDVISIIKENPKELLNENMSKKIQDNSNDHYERHF